VGGATVLERRISTLEKRGQRAAAFVPDGTWYDFKIACSCPPDKRVHIRGGNAAREENWGGLTILQNFTPSTIADFTNIEETQLELLFANANYYLPTILCYHGDWIGRRDEDPQYELPVYAGPVGVEVATAVEAEAQIDAWLNGYTKWCYLTFPLHGIVFRNDGQAGVPYAILPIDSVNRGRSYLYRDARARNSLAQ